MIKVTFINIKVLLFSAFLLICFSRCSKENGVEYEGNYNCTVHYHYWDMTPTTIDKTYTEILSVTRSGTFINVLGHEIPISSLMGGQEYYEGYGQNYFKARLVNETIFVTINSGGLGGGTTTTYEGSKQ